VSLIVIGAAGGALVAWGCSTLLRLRDPDDRVLYMARIERAGLDSSRMGSAYAANRSHRASLAKAAILFGIAILTASTLTFA
jgi:hypothetical protein